MRKKLYSVLFVLALCGAFGTACQPSPNGDANNDGVVDLADATCVAADLGGTTSSCAGEGANSDVNGDGQIDALDLVLVSDGYSGE